MIRRPISNPVRVALGIASFVCLGFMYSALSNAKYEENPKQSTVPGWSKLWEGVQVTLKPDTIDYDGQSWLWVDTKASFTRLVTGLAIGISAGIILGVAMGVYTPVEAILLPPLSFLAKIPPIAMLAVFFALVGVNFALFYSMIAYGVLPTLAQSIHQAVKNDVPDGLINKAHTLGASHAEVIWNVIFRQIFPRVLDAVRLQIGPAMVYLIAAEWSLTDVGFGYRLRFQSRLLQMHVVYVYLVYLGVIGLAIDYGLIWLRKKLCPWFG